MNAPQDMKTAGRSSAGRLVQHFIDGEFTSGTSGQRFDLFAPHDGSLIGQADEAGEADVDAAVRAATAALHGPWGTLGIDERCEMLRAVADGIIRRIDDFAQAEMEDVGQPVSHLRHAAMPRGAANFRIFADLVKGLSNESFQTSTPDGSGAINYAVRKPKGVIGVISPWNGPLLLMTWKVAPALACGNTVVVKPSEETPSTAALLAEIMNEAGVPRGVYNVVNGFGPGSTGEFLTRHRGVNAITFTGESGTGAAIMKAAADGIREVSFELGGKNSAVVFADADLEVALEGVMRSAFMNTGQACVGTERVLVERPLFDHFVAELKTRAETLHPGDPKDPKTSFGPLISREHREKVLSYYAIAEEDGAVVVTGGGVPDLGPALAGGAWVEPTIWTGLPDDSRVIQEEIFGPCCHVRPFDTEEEAVRLANDTEYGLATSIYTRDLSRAHRVAGRIDVGITWVNCWFLRDLRTPFGGTGLSGIGREGGFHSLEFYTELRNVCIKL